MKNIEEWTVLDCILYGAAALVGWSLVLWVVGYVVGFVGALWRGLNG